MSFDLEWLLRKRNRDVFYESAIEKIIYQGFSAEIHLSPALSASTIEGVQEDSALVFKLSQCISISTMPVLPLVISPAEKWDDHLVDVFMGIELVSLETIDEWVHLKIECFEYMLTAVCKEIRLHIQ